VALGQLLRITFRGQHRKFREKFRAAMRMDALAGHQPSKCTQYFHVKQMWNDERVAASGQIASEGIGQGAVGKEFHDYGRIQNNHRASRNSHTI
jgi:hypothetical protein